MIKKKKNIKNPGIDALKNKDISSKPSLLSEDQHLENKVQLLNIAIEYIEKLKGSYKGKKNIEAKDVKSRTEYVKLAKKILNELKGLEEKAEEKKLKYGYEGIVNALKNSINIEDIESP